MLFQNEHLQQGRCTTIGLLIVGFGWCATYFIHFNCIIETKLRNEFLQLKIYFSFIYFFGSLPQTNDSFWTN